MHGSLRSWLALLVACSARGSLRSWLAPLVARCACAPGSLRPVPDVRPGVRPVPLLKGHLTQVLNGGRTWVRLRTSAVCSEGPFSAAPCHVGRARETRPPTMDAPRSAARRLPMGSPCQVECLSPPLEPSWPCLPRPAGVHRSLHRLRPPSGPPRERPLYRPRRRRRGAKVARRGTRRTAPSRPSTARRKCSGSRVSCNSTTPASRCR